MMIFALALIAQVGHQQGWSPRSSAVCEEAQIDAAMTRMQDSLVTVEGHFGEALGVLVGDGRHALVPLFAVRVGRGFEVRALGQASLLQATVVATDEDHNLAVLELGTSAGRAAKLNLREVGAGKAVLQFGISHHRATLVSPGVVNMQDKLRIASPWVIGNFWGGPVTDCDGAMLGVQVGSDLGPIAPASLLAALRSKVGTQPIYRGGWSFLHPSVATMLQFSPGESWFGLSLGTALVGNDKLIMPIRAGVTARIPPERGFGVKARRGVRVQTEWAIGYRWLLNEGSVPVYLVPTAGLMGSYAWREEAQGSEHRWRLSPTLGLAVNLSFFELAYQAQIDVLDPRQTIHQVGFGAQF